MDKPNYTKQELIELLHKNPQQGSDVYLGMIKSNASDPKLYFKAIYLKSILLAAKTLDEKNECISEMVVVWDEAIKMESNAETNISTSIEENNIATNGITKYEVAYEGSLLVKEYGAFKLNAINIKLRLGEITGVVGENGNGKTTLLKLVAGVLKQSSGTMNYGILQKKESKLIWSEVKKQIAYLPQEIPHINGTVKQIIAQQAALHGILGKENEFQCEYILNRMSLTQYSQHYFHQLSGGYKLRLALSSILVWKPKLLILDEPLANLDINAQVLVLNDLKNLSESLHHPISILISSQNIKEVEAVSDKLMILRQGNVQYYGNVSGIGQQRQTNVFEIISQLSLLKLREAFSEMQEAKVMFNGLAFIIETPLHIETKQFIQFCQQKDIVFSYFNDISSSSKKILYRNSLYA